MSELKPCPFCGGEAEMVSELHVSCTTFGCIMYAPETHIKQWNTRSQPDNSELLKKLHMKSYFTFENNSTPPTVQVVEWRHIVEIVKALGDK